MAVINKNNSYMEFPLQISRQYGAPIDKFEVFYSLTDAQTYAASNPLAYVGQRVVVVDESNNNKVTEYIIADAAGTLREVGAGSGTVTAVDDEAAMLALPADDTKVGQQVYRKDTKTIWILTSADPSKLTSWSEVAGSQASWTGTENRVGFYALTDSAYKAIVAKDANTLYFITDAGKVFKGDTDVTKSMSIVSEFGEASAAIDGVLYFNESTLECRFKKADNTWAVFSPGYLTDGVNWAEADSNKFATIGLIKKGIKTAIDELSFDTAFDNSTGIVTVGDGAGATLTGVTHDPTYDSSQLKLTIPVYGGTDVVVDIPKDIFVESGKYYENYPETGEAQYHNVIVLILKNQDEPVIIPADGLVDIYTADNTGKDVVITITDDNKISAVAKIDPVSGNALVTSENGLKVDISGKIDKMVDATGGKITISDTDGNVAESSFNILSEGEMGDSTAVVPTANLIAAAIATAVNAIAEDKVDKVVGTVNNLVAFAADGAIQDINIKAGGATMSATPDANTLATEKAVEAAIEDAKLKWAEIN